MELREILVSVWTEFLPRMYGISLASYLPVLILAELQNAPNPLSCIFSESLICKAP